MIIKNSFIISLLLLFSPCLGMGFKEDLRKWDDIPDLHLTNTEFLDEKAIQELHDKYAAMIDKAIAEKQDLNILKAADFDPLFIKLAECGFNNLIKKMLDNGADIEIQTLCCASALVKAACFGHLKTVLLLLNHGADIENKNGIESPLINATTCFLNSHLENKLAITILLLTYGAQVNVQDNFKSTPLHRVLEKIDNSTHLCTEIRTSLVIPLIKHGANLYIKNFFKRTPLDLAQENFPELVPIMLEEAKKAAEIR
jgi:ankyrin repeat protein